MADRRRLQDAVVGSPSGASCEALGALEVVSSTWLGLNPLRHVANDRAFNGQVLRNATVRVLRFYHCGQEVKLEFGPRDEPLMFDLPRVQPYRGEGITDYKEITTCLLFDDRAHRQEWHDRDTETAVGELCSAADGAGPCSCSAFHGGGAYTAINRLVPAFTTATSTTTTSTTTALPPVAPPPEESIVVPLAAAGAAGFVCTVIVVLVIWRWKRRRKLSRVAAADEVDGDLKNGDGLAKKVLSDEEKAAKALERLRVAALGGDAGARRELFNRARTETAPSSRLVTAVDEVTLQIKRERTGAVIRAAADPSALQRLSPQPPMVAARLALENSPMPSRPSR